MINQIILVCLLRKVIKKQIFSIFSFLWQLLVIYAISHCLCLNENGKKLDKKASFIPFTIRWNIFEQQRIIFNGNENSNFVKNYYGQPDRKTSIVLLTTSPMVEVYWTHKFIYFKGWACEKMLVWGGRGSFCNRSTPFWRRRHFKANWQSVSSKANTNTHQWQILYQRECEYSQIMNKKLWTKNWCWLKSKKNHHQRTLEADQYCDSDLSNFCFL